MWANGRLSSGLLMLVSDASPMAANVGWAQLIPDDGTTTPVGAAIYGFTQGGILITEAGVPAVTFTTHARINIDKSGGHDTGLAVANPGNASMRITATAYQLDGTTPAGRGPGRVDPAQLGHDAMSAGQLIEDL
jgi:hypothetical protein